MVKPGLILLFTLMSLFASATRATAQFSLAAPGDNTQQMSVPLTLSSAPITIDVTNAAKAKFERRTAWRLHNAVDYRVSLTGILTQYNKAWTTNNQNAVSLELAGYYYHTYTKNLHTSLFKFDAVFGENYIDKMWFKNQDMFKLYYLSSWKFTKNGIPLAWAYSISTDFTSQFAEGFASRTDKTVWSNFMAPAMWNLGTGVTYTSPDPKLPFIVTLNVLSGNALFVLDDRIDPVRRAKLGIPLTIVYKEDGKGGTIIDEAATIYPFHKNYKIEGGFSVNVAFNRTFSFFASRQKSFGRGRWGGVLLQYNTTFSSFYGWITQVSRRKDRDNPVRALVPTVNWTNSLSFNPLRFLVLEFRMTTLYDRSQVDKVQMQYYLRLGLTYRYKNR